MSVIDANTIKEKIDTWLTGVYNDSISNYIKLGLRASGQWERELETQSEVNPTQFKALILGMDYTYYLEQGRGKTQNKGTGKSLQEIIREWIDVKGISPNGISKDSLAFLITRKIHREGITVPNKFNAGGLVSDIVTQERVDLLVQEIGFSILTDVKSLIKKQLKSGNNRN